MLAKSDFQAFYHAPLATHPAIDQLGVTGEFQGLFHSIASLVGLPDDGRLFAKSEPAVRCLLEAWQAMTGVGFDWDQFDALYARISSDDGKKSTWGTRRESPMFALVLSHMEVTQHNIIPSHFVALMPYLVRRVWQCYSQVDLASDDYLYHLCLVSKKLLASAPAFPPQSRFNWTYAERLAIAKRAINFTLADDVGLASDPDWTYINDILFRDRKSLGHGGGGHSGERHARWLLFENQPIFRSTHDDLRGQEASDYWGDEEGLKPDARGKVVTSAFVPFSMDFKVIIEAGEFEIDYVDGYGFSFPAHWFEDAWQAKRKMRGKIEAMVSTERVCPWDVHCLSMDVVRKVLSRIRSGSDDGAVLAMVLFLGMQEGEIKRLQLCGIPDRQGEDGQSTEQLLHGSRFYDPETQELWWINERGFEDREGYLNVPIIVRLALPQVIADVMPVCTDPKKHLFSDIHIRSAKKYLTSMGIDGIKHPSLSRLRKTFEAYFVNGAGLPEVFADHLRGTKRPYLISQHHYISLDWHHHVEQWHSMVSALCDYSGYQISGLLAGMRFKHPYSSDEALQRIYAGAVHTPSDGVLTKHCSALYSDLPDNVDAVLASVEQWNAYVAYLYFMMAVCTGRRPLRDPFSNLDNFDLESDAIFVDDKHNKSFKESRVIPLCLTLKRSLEIYAQLDARQRMRMKLRSYWDETSVGEPFLIDVDDKKLVKVSPASCDSLVGRRLQEAGYCIGLGNGMRHFFLSRLQRVGITREGIDSVSGHRHMGRETEMSSSMMNWDVSANRLRAVIEIEIAQFLGMKVPFDGQ